MLFQLLVSVLDNLIVQRWNHALLWVDVSLLIHPHIILRTQKFIFQETNQVMKFSVGTSQKFDTASDIESKLEGLKSGVTEVSLGGNSYGVGACEALANHLKTVNTLKIAKLDDMFTGRLSKEIPQSMELLLEALLNCPNLHTLDLSDNAFGIATIAPLEHFLANHTPLQHLILANNGFGPEAGARVGNALEKLAHKKLAEGHSTKLETVVCGRNRLENGSMEAWARFIKSHGSIKELRLYQNGIRQEGIEHLMLHGLKHSPNLVKLDLQDNTFTAKGSSAMVEVLDQWPNIKEIGISDCLLSSKGGELLAEKIKTTDSLGNLEILRLQYNEIDEKGLQHLSDAVKKTLTQLKLLELNGNKFSEDHDSIDAINAIFTEKGFGELDELDDMEEDSDDEEEASADEEEADELAAKLAEVEIK